MLKTIWLFVYIVLLISGLNLGTALIYWKSRKMKKITPSLNKQCFSKDCFFSFLIQFQFVYWLYSITFEGIGLFFFLSLFNSSLYLKKLIEWFAFIKSDSKFLFRWKLSEQNETRIWLIFYWSDFWLARLIIMLLNTIRYNISY